MKFVISCVVLFLVRIMGLTAHQSTLFKGALMNGCNIIISSLPAAILWNDDQISGRLKTAWEQFEKFPFLMHLSGGLKMAKNDEFFRIIPWLCIVWDNLLLMARCFFLVDSFLRSLFWKNLQMPIFYFNLYPTWKKSRRGYKHLIQYY